MNSQASLYVYVLSSKTRQLLVGFTYDLPQRLAEHRTTAAANRRTIQPTRLVHFEGFDDPLRALHRESELRALPRATQHAIVRRNNPTWRDLTTDL